MNVWVKRALIAVPIVVVLFFGAILLYVNVIRDDAPDELDTDDLAAAVEGPATTRSPASPSPTVRADRGAGAGDDLGRRRRPRPQPRPACRTTAPGR